MRCARASQEVRKRMKKRVHKGSSHFWCAKLSCNVSCRAHFDMKLALALAIMAVFLPGLRAFYFEREPEDDILDKWLKEQMAENQASRGAVCTLKLCNNVTLLFVCKNAQAGAK